MTIRLRFVFIILTAFMLLAPPIEAGSVSAATCSVADVQEAIDQALSGDIVRVPAGKCTWDTDVTVSNLKRLHLIGAGSTSTVIALDANVQLILSTSDSNVTGFGFTASAKSTGDEWINVRGDGGWRIHHNSFTNTSGRNNICLYVNGGTGIPHPVGVVDHNTFNNCRIYVIGTLFITNGSIWATPTNWGSSDQVFIEDNAFIYSLTQGNCIDGQFSARYVARFNIATGCPFEAHGAQNGRGTRAWEIYHNTWAGIGGNADFATFLRGGTGIAFSNTFDSSYVQTLRFDDPRLFSLYNPPNCYCDGTCPIDGNLIRKGLKGSGWPCRDQVGRGQDAFEFTFASGAGLFPIQASEPMPLFLNRQNGSDVIVAFTNSTMHTTGTVSDFVMNGRDYQKEDANFDGTVGTGVGVIARRPATCTTGVYYWATDEGEWNRTNSQRDGRLYKCTDTNRWALHYTPYSYPHPLTLTLSAPWNLRIVPSR